MSYIDEWRAAGGNVHGPNVETVTMPLDRYLAFRETLSAQTGEAVAQYRHKSASDWYDGVLPSNADQNEEFETRILYTHPPAADFRAALQKAWEAMPLPKRITPARLEYWKAGARAAIQTANAALASVAGK